MVKFKGKAVMSIEELNANEIPHEKGWVEGNLVSPLICGPLVDTAEDALIPEWWARVIPESIHQVEYTKFDELSKKHGYFRAVLIDSGMSEEEVAKMPEDEVEGVYGAMADFAQPY